MSKERAIKKIYFDVCSLCRPFDDQSSMRVKLETDAVFLIQQMILRKSYISVCSPVHYFEISKIEDEHERLELLFFLDHYAVRGQVSLLQVEEKTKRLVSLGFGYADAAHLAFAESMADYFISCDDKLIRKSRKVELHLKVLNPVEFCQRELFV